MSVFGLDSCSHILIHRSRLNLGFLVRSFITEGFYQQSENQTKKKAGCPLTSMAEVIKPSKTWKKPANSRQRPQGQNSHWAGHPPTMGRNHLSLTFSLRSKRRNMQSTALTWGLPTRGNLYNLEHQVQNVEKLKTGNHHKLVNVKYGRTRWQDRWEAPIWKRWLEKGYPRSLLITYNFECSVESTK